MQTDAVFPALITVALAIAAASWPMRSGGAVCRRVEHGLAALGVLLLVAVKLADGARSSEFVLAALPLQVCDLSSIASIVALLGGPRLASSIALYFGLALSSLALLFPDLGAGIGSAEYWLFWARHGVILASALYLLLVRGFRPTWGDYARWCAFAAAYIAVVAVANRLLGTNYAFIADRTLEYTRVVDSFGPWPGRAVVMLGLAFVQAAALTLALSSLSGARACAVDRSEASTR